MILVPKKWREFQHYSTRKPPWIKLHRHLLDDFDFQSLPVASRALAPMLWLLASEHPNGEIDARPENLAFRFHQSAKWVGEALEPLINKGYFEDASIVLAKGLQRARPETEREVETEKETTLSRSLKTANGDSAHEVLKFLNVKTGKQFRMVETNLKLIRDRLKSGVTVQDCKTLIARKCNDWAKKPEMLTYLRPATLFNLTKFEQYLGEIEREEPCNAPAATKPSVSEPSAAAADGLPLMPASLQRSPIQIAASAAEPESLAAANGLELSLGK